MINFKQGTVSIKKRGHITHNVESLEEGLAILAQRCQPCGCDPCTGISTQYDAGTGELLGIYYNDGVQVIEPYDTAVTNAKALVAAQ